MVLVIVVELRPALAGLGKGQEGVLGDEDTPCLQQGGSLGLYTLSQSLNYILCIEKLCISFYINYTQIKAWKTKIYSPEI